MGALPIGIISAVSIFPKLYALNTRDTGRNNNNQRNLSRQELIDQTLTAQRLSGLYMRVLAGLVGAVLSQGHQQTYLETAATLWVAQVPHLMMRPVSHYLTKHIHLGLTYLADLLQENHQSRTAQRIRHRTLDNAHDSDRHRQFLNTQNRLLTINQSQLNQEQQHTNTHDSIRGNNEVTQQLLELADQLDIEPHEVVDLMPSFLKHVAICPITADIMTDPIILPALGQAYHFERRAAEQWIEQNHRHPIIRSEPISSNQALLTDHALKATIIDWLETKISQPISEEN